jgi:hypothetical protein
MVLLVGIANCSPGNPVFKTSKKGGFLFPIKPGQPASITGNMGEIRSNHFHGGLDIRTGWASGVAVLAAKDAYVSRVIMAGEGYGNTIFLTNWGVLSHELCHLYQRNVPCIFDSLYHQWGFTPIERETILLLISNHNSEYIDNPDISSQYFTYQGVILPVYTHSMGKTLLRIDEEKQYSTFSKPLKIPFLHPSFLWQLNHPHEMFAEIFESFFRKLNK